MGTYSEKVKLTTPVVKDARPVATDKGMRQRVLFDTQTPGFGVVIGSIKKTYFAQRNNRRVTIGHHGPWTLDLAREAAKAKLRDFNAGPQVADPKVKAHAVTLQEGLDLAVRTATSKGRSERTIGDYKYLMARY